MLKSPAPVPGRISGKCAVPYCNNKYYWPIRQPDYRNKAFFKVPPDTDKRKKWLEILNIPYSNKTNKALMVCQDHFDENQFTSNLRTRLLKFASPRQFLTSKVGKSEDVATIDENVQENTRFEYLLPSGRRVVFYSSPTNSTEVNSN